MAAVPVDAYPSPIKDLDAVNWDDFVVQGIRWTDVCGPPGVSGARGKVEVQGAERSYRWDTKNQKGGEGNTDTYGGTKPGPFRVRFFLWTDRQFESWQTYSINFGYPAAKTGIVRPVFVYHPALALLDISAAVCLGLGAPERHSEDGMWVATVRLKEFKPPIVPQNTSKTPPAASAVSPPNLPGHVPSPAILALEATLKARQQTIIDKGTPGG